VVGPRHNGADDRGRIRPPEEHDTNVWIKDLGFARVSNESRGRYRDLHRGKARRLEGGDSCAESISDAFLDLAEIPPVHAGFESGRSPEPHQVWRRVIVSCTDDGVVELPLRRKQPPGSNDVVIE